jgi:hypothetical protein
MVLGYDSEEKFREIHILPRTRAYRFPVRYDWGIFIIIKQIALLPECI